MGFHHDFWVYRRLIWIRNPGKISYFPTKGLFIKALNLKLQADIEWTIGMHFDEICISSRASSRSD